MPERPRVSVLGSLNTDISVTVPQLPGPGETVLGAAAVIGAGGKGANQAVAAARLGAGVRMAGCIGDDDFGRRLAEGLTREGVDTGGVRALAGVTSGLALISVDASGENAITVAPGANAHAGEQEVAAAFAAGCDVLVLSAEVPVSVLAGALARARTAGVTSVLNLAPAPAGAAGLLAGGVDWLVVNVPEASAVLGRPVPPPGVAEAGGPGGGVAQAGGPGGDVAEAGGAGSDGSGDGGPGGDGPGGDGAGEGAAGHGDTGPGGVWRAVADLVAAGARHAVITLGSAGAVVAAAAGTGAGGRAGQTARPEPGAAPQDGAGGGTSWDGRPVLVPGFAVAAVDSVGAGDAFVGALAVALASGAGPVPAVRAACAAGAAAVTRRGAQAALPGLADVRAATGQDEWPQFPRSDAPLPGASSR